MLHFSYVYAQIRILSRNACPRLKRRSGYNGALPLQLTSGTTPDTIWNAIDQTGRAQFKLDSARNPYQPHCVDAQASAPIDAVSKCSHKTNHEKEWWKSYAWHIPRFLIFIKVRFFIHSKFWKQLAVTSRISVFASMMYQLSCTWLPWKGVVHRPVSKAGPGSWEWVVCHPHCRTKESTLYIGTTFPLSKYCGFSPVNRLQPFLDEYGAGTKQRSV